MSRIARSRSLPTLLSRRSRSLSSSSTLSSSSYSSSSSSEAAAAAAAEEHVAGERPPPTPPPSTGARKSRSLLKFGAFASLAGVLGAAGYATYAYTLDEVDQKTSSFRKTANLSVGDDAPTFEKFRALIYSTAMKVPVKAIELYLDIRSKVEEHVRGFTEPSSDKLLPDLLPEEQHVYTLVLDLNETLVYSDWQRDRGWRTFKRPGVEAFLEHLAKFYEIVVYSDQLNMYVDPVVERLDQKGCIRYKLSRAATKYQNGKHYRDLSKLNRDPSRILYVSGHCLESTLQPENCVSIKPWKLENDDTALLDLLPFLEFVAVHRPADIRSVLASYQGRDIATEFIERSKEMKRRMQEEKRPSFWRR
ncbi:mitochondrial import inner membrane translocase subunit TIM50-like [Ananas comosus]|uniref:Mitochondrial import inner membrane translocase subunit TIM50 n=1 Tax=Ananas comosus TaxID=4615 RepID=A0A6P5G532_ANACO|nr:mitochondrial import inner membrane translocase subunit TIM50-like [Ananas comosus]